MSWGGGGGGGGHCSKIELMLKLSGGVQYTYSYS